MFQYFQNNLEIGLFVYKLHIFKSWQLIKVSLKLHVDQKPNLSEGWIQPTSFRLTTSRLFTPKNHITTVHSFKTAKALSCCPFASVRTEGLLYLKARSIYRRRYSIYGRRHERTSRTISHLGLGGDYNCRHVKINFGLDTEFVYFLHSPVCMFYRSRSY